MTTEKTFTFRTYQELFKEIQKSALYNKRSISKEIEYQLEKVYFKQN